MVGRPDPSGSGAWSAALAAVACAWMAVTVAGCGTGVFEPRGPEPLLYVVLNQTVEVEGEPAQLAFLLSAGQESPPYRSASRFEITRLSDDATFPWRDRGLEGPAPFSPGELSVPLEEANFRLESQQGPDGGLVALTPGASYQLRVETGGATVTGTTTIPEAFDAAMDTVDGQRVVSWPSVTGAGGYLLAGPLLDSLAVARPLETRDLRRVLQDTTVVLPDFVPSGGEIRVVALDENLARYLTEFETSDPSGQSGGEGGRGVFGAVSEARVGI